jgi:hypothetical protein
MIQTLRNLIDEDARRADTVEKRDLFVSKAQRLLKAIAKRVDPTMFGAKGGKKTAERGPDYFRQIAAMRKTKSGGRPRKHPTEQ